MAELEFILAKQRVTVLAEKALLWLAERTLFVADVHFGKDATFRQAQRWVPPGTTGNDLARLTALIERHAVERVTILGDAFHSEHADEENTFNEILDWKKQTNCEVLMIPGNHDRKTEAIARGLGFQLHPEGHLLGPWSLHHHPTTKPQVGYVFCGHLHPMAIAYGKARQRLRLPCFWANKKQCVLPAFGGFTGGSIVRPKQGDRVILVADDQLLDASA